MGLAKKYTVSFFNCGGRGLRMGGKWMGVLWFALRCVALRGLVIWRISLVVYLPFFFLLKFNCVIRSLVFFNGKFSLLLYYEM